LEYKNFTDLTVAPEFILREIEAFDTSKLRFHLKFHKRKDQEVSGYYRFDDHFILAAVRKKQRFPLKNEWAVATRKCRNRRGWTWVWDREQARDRDELMVWIAAHELFHFLRHTKQVPGINRETRANRFAFEWMRRYLAEKRAASDAAAAAAAVAAAAAEPPPTAAAPPAPKLAAATKPKTKPPKRQRPGTRGPKARRPKTSDTEGQLLMPWSEAS